MTQLLNSPLEVGVRVVAMLNALYPRQADLSRIVLLDHVALHSEDFSGAESLHPAVPVRIGELGMKRELVRQGIILRAYADSLFATSTSPESTTARATTLDLSWNLLIPPT